MLASETKIQKNNFLFFAMLCYFIIDTARIQDVMPISFLRPGIIVLSLICLAVLNNIRSVKFNKPLILILLFAVLLWLHVPFARNNRFAFNTAVTFSSIMLVCMCMNAYINTRWDIIKIYSTLYIVTLYLAVYALLHSGRGSGGYVADENDMALLLNVIIPIGFFLWQINNGVKKWIYLAGVFILIIASASTMSRGGFVGLACMSAVLIIRSKKKLILLICLSAALVTAAVIVDTYFPSKSQKKARYLDTMSTSTDVEDSTAQERLWSWLAAYEMFKDNPLGVGGNNFQVRFPEYQAERFKRGMWGRVAHSVWFTLLPELGLPGIFIFFMLLKHNLMTCLRIERSVSQFADVIKPLTYSIVAFMATGTFISVLYYPFIWYLSAFISGIEKASMDLLPRNEQLGLVNKNIGSVSLL